MSTSSPLKDFQKVQAFWREENTVIQHLADLVSKTASLNGPVELTRKAVETSRRRGLISEEEMKEMEDHLDKWELEA